MVITRASQARDGGSIPLCRFTYKKIYIILKLVKKLKASTIKKLLIFVVVLSIICVVLGITIKRQNEKNKNTVLFVMDNFYYENVYKKSEKELKKVFKIHYAKPILIVYDVYRFSYDNLRNEIEEKTRAYCPTHIIISPISALNLYKFNETPTIAEHNRGRARLISLSPIQRTELFDASYPISKEELYEDLASLLDAQSLKVAFIYNINEGRDGFAPDIIRSYTENDILFLDEGMRELGDFEATELYNRLQEQNIEIISTLGFNNLNSISNLYESDKKQILFILPDSLENSVKNNQIGAIITIDFPSLVDEILDNVQITDTTSLGNDKAPLKIEIRNNKISPMPKDEDII